MATKKPKTGDVAVDSKEPVAAVEPDQAVAEPVQGAEAPVDNMVTTENEVAPNAAAVQVLNELFTTTMQECSKALIACPDALDFGVVKEDGKAHYYKFFNESKEAKAARAEIKPLLKHLYNNGAYSNRDFAERLRVPELSIQACIDDEFIEMHNL